MSITSANAVLMLGVTSLFSVPQQIQAFAADDVYDIDPLDVAETQMGVDGYLTGGFVFMPIKQGISLLADSPSNDLFDQWYASQRKVKDLYVANGTITLPALGKKFTMTRGILTQYQPVPSAGKTLKSRKHVITWQSVDPAPY
jgi:hypothetical protein